jgi:recombination protein RecR
MSTELLPLALRNILNDMERFPGIGQKSAQRIAFYLMEQDSEFLERIATNLTGLKSGIKKCVECGMLTENEKCKICMDDKRDKNTVCVVESALDVIAIERIGQFGGRYYVLGGLLSPLDNVGPEDIGIVSFLDNVREKNFEEVILALNPSTEGETTALYLKNLLQQEFSNLAISRLAQGLPTGAAIEYADDLTLSRAFSGRQVLTKNI